MQALLSEMQKSCLMQGFFCISGRQTCMTACHFHRSAGPFAILQFYNFTISFPLGSTQGFLHLGPQNLHVGPPFSPVGRTVCCFMILRFYYFISIGFQARGFCISAARPACRPPFAPVGGPFTISLLHGSKQEVFASRAAKPACQPASRKLLHLGFHRSAGPFTILLFYYFISIGFQAGGFLHLERKTA